MRLFLVRHGETEYNRLGRALGRYDIPLNEKGREQARRLAGALAREPFAAIYSSPLQRCLDTAMAIAAVHGLPVQTLPELIEMDIGEAEGLTYAQVRERFPGLLQRWLSPEAASMALPGGEGLAAVQERAWRAIESIAAAHRGETVAVVTHNFVILSLLARALGMPLGSFRRLRHGVAAVSVLELDGEAVTLVRFNDTCHLEEGPSAPWVE